MQELCYLTALEIRRLLTAGEVSAMEVLEQHFNRIDQCNHHVNAIVTESRDLARKQAQAVDKQLRAGQPAGLLAGLPVAHKDLTDTKGIRTTYGSPWFTDHIPARNDLIIDRLQNEGGLSLGKTNVPEWGAGSQTFNPIFGATRNPYDLSKTCGGSSGGAAVALACGMTALADGSDMGGSLRNPASFCNVVGLRPSPGRVPSTSVAMAWNTMGVQGPMARTVSDLALMLAAISGPDSRCPIAIEQSGKTFLPPLALPERKLNLAFSTDFNHLPVEQPIQKIVRDSAAIFAGMGMEVSEACPDFAAADTAFKTLRAWQFAATHKERLEQDRDLYKESIIWNVEAGLKLSAMDLAAAENARTRLYLALEAFFEDYDYLILPVSQVLPFDINDEYPTHINGEQMETYIDWMKSCYYISTTGLPAISIPAGFSNEGLPIGIQIVGRHHDELGLLQLAAAFENETLCWQRHPDLEQT